MTREELAALVNWSEDEFNGALENACEQADARPSEIISVRYDEKLFDWIAELIGDLADIVTRRGIVMGAAELYCHAGRRLEVARGAMRTPPHSSFMPINILEIGLVDEAFELALMSLDAPESARRLRLYLRTVPPFNPWKHHHATGDTLEHILEGGMGAKAADGMRQHLELCAGCRENLEYERDRPPSESTTSLTP